MKPEDGHIATESGQPQDACTAQDWTHSVVVKLAHSLQPHDETAVLHVL